MTDKTQKKPSTAGIVKRTAKAPFRPVLSGYVRARSDIEGSVGRIREDIGTYARIFTHIFGKKVRSANSRDVTKDAFVKGYENIYMASWVYLILAVGTLCYLFFASDTNIRLIIGLIFLGFFGYYLNCLRIMMISRLVYRKWNAREGLKLKLSWIAFIKHLTSNTELLLPKKINQ